jgi:hypothetical protein
MFIEAAPTAMRTPAGCYELLGSLNDLLSASRASRRFVKNCANLQRPEKPGMLAPIR